MGLLFGLFNAVADLVLIALKFSFIFVPLGILTFRRPWEWRDTGIFIAATLSSPVFLVCWIRSGFNRAYAAFDHILGLIVRSEEQCDDKIHT